MMFAGTLTNFDGSLTCEVVGEWAVNRRPGLSGLAWSGWVQATDGSTIQADDYTLDVMSGHQTAIKVLQTLRPGDRNSRLRFEGSGPIPSAVPIRTDEPRRRMAMERIA